VVKSIPLEDLSAAIDLGIRTGFGNDFLRIGSIKLFADGALGPRTAAMLQPYEFEPENRGMLLMDEEEMVEHGKKAVANGFSLAVHAIGDRANHEVLRAYRQLRIFEQELASASGDFVSLNSLRHRIEHVQVIHPEEIQLLAELGIIASMQPIHALSDMQMADTYWGERAKYSYAWKSQLSSGAALAFGSDAPVDSPNPWWGIYAAVTRKRIDGYPGKSGWYPEQKISLLEAIQAYTTGPAFTAGTERYLGIIKENYLADLQVLDVDPFTTDPDQLHKIHPSAVMIGGKWVVNNLV
jgi:hypothetical protein